MSDSQNLCERVPLQGSFKLYTKDSKGSKVSVDIENTECIGFGNSCIVYSVKVTLSKDEPKRNMILKEFYPDPRVYTFCMKGEGSGRYIEHPERCPDIMELLEFFKKSYERQCLLADDEDLKHIVVSPRSLAYGESKKSFFSFENRGYYALYDADYGRSLDQIEHLDFEHAVEIVRDIAEALNTLHKKNIIYMDLSPKNILFYGNEEKGRIKLFDFDASVQTDEVANLTSLRAQGETWLIPPKLRDKDLNEMRKYIHTSLDLYPLGAILFRYVFGRDLAETQYISEDEESKEIFTKLLKDFFAEPKNERYSELIQTKLQYILNNTLRSYGGYVNASEVVKDLDVILSELKKDKKIEKPFLLSSYTITKYPLYDYLNTNEEKPAVDVAIIGEWKLEDDLRGAFFKSIFSAAQMLDTEMNIRFIGKDASDYRKILLKSCPELSKTTCVFENGKQISKELDPEITDKAFANLYFNTERFNQVDIMSTLKKIPSRYFVVFDEENLQKIVSGLDEIYKEKDEKIFVCYPLSKNTKKIKASSRIILWGFSSKRNITKDHDNFETESMRRAYQVHRYYKKFFDERATESEVKKSFYSDPYNIESSLRAAASIPYKLKSCGIEYDEKAAHLFYQKVLDEQNPNTGMLRNQMIYLEHRSWMCYTIASGQRKPTKEQLQAYFYTDGNNHRNKKEQLHPLICESRSNDPATLRCLPKKEWRKIIKSNEKLESYDLLDRMSLLIHDLCEKKSNEIRMSVEQNIEHLSDLIEKESDRFNFSENVQIRNQIAFLKILTQKLFSSEQNIQSVWDRNYHSLKALLDKRHYWNNDILMLMETIREKMLVVKEKNMFTDYKYLDFDLVRGIPMLLWDKKIHTLYKVFNESRLSQNIVSVIMLEPENMILIVENEDQKNKYAKQIQCMEEFLKQKRGMDRLNFKVCTLEEISEEKQSEKLNIFDVTDAPHKFRIHPQLSKLPYMEYNLDWKRESNLDELEFYTQQKTLTVEETFPFYNAEVISAKKKNLMLYFADHYEKLWEIYLKTDKSLWYHFCTKVEAICKKEENGYSFREKTENPPAKILSQENRVLQKDAKTYQSQATNWFIVKIAEIDAVLSELKANGVIIDYELPLRDVYRSFIRITTTEKEDITKINDMLTKAQKGMIRFSYDAEKEKIIEENMQFDETIELSLEEGGSDLKTQLDNLIKVLYDPSKGEDQQKFIRKISGEANFVKKLDASRCSVKFEFVSPAVKNFFLRAGNALEVYAYHSIVQETSVFDDVKMNVEIQWKDWDSGESSAPIDNEIDLVCTKGLQTFLISCKQSNPQPPFLYQIGYHASRFGINTKPIIICSREPQTETEKNRHAAILKRSKEMKVCFIDYSMIRDLPKYIENIANGKDDWENI